MEESDSTLVEPSSVTVIGVAKDVHQASSTPAKVTKKRENSVESNRSTKERKAGASVSKGSVRKSPAKSTKLTTDNKLEQLDKKWSERFSGLEAMLLSESVNQPDFNLWSDLHLNLHHPVLPTTTNYSSSLRQTNRPLSAGTNQLTGHCSSAACTLA